MPKPGGFYIEQMIVQRIEINVIRFKLRSLDYL